MCITETSKDDYDNDWSDNCDYNFGTFDGFGVKNYQKLSHNMILMSRYKGQLHGGKRVKQFGQGSPPPSPFRAMPERKHFFCRRFSLTTEPVLSSRDKMRSRSITCQIPIPKLGPIQIPGDSPLPRPALLRASLLPVAIRVNEKRLFYPF